MPTIHLYYALLGAVFGTSIPKIRFAHHVLVSLPGIVVGGWVGLAYVVLVNSGWLLAFHGNVGQQAAGLILLAMWLDAPWVSAGLVVFAILFEPKLAFSGMLLSLYYGWFSPFFWTAALVAVIGVSLIWAAPTVWAWRWEANITIPRRMVEFRRKNLKRNPVTSAAQGYLYVLPWLIGSDRYKARVAILGPVAIYLIIIHSGVVVRQNHYLPIIPWIALVLPPQFIAALLVVDLVSAGLYRDDIWLRFYPGLRNTNKDAREVGTWLKDKAGDVWVNGFHSGIYIYSGKPPVYGMTEQFEIRDSVPERRGAWRKQFKYRAPNYVVVGPAEGWKFNGTGYNMVAQSQEHKVYERF